MRKIISLEYAAKKKLFINIFTINMHYIKIENDIIIISIGILFNTFSLFKQAVDFVIGCMLLE
jgi:hypothetical protein